MESTTSTWQEECQITKAESQTFNTPSNTSELDDKYRFTVIQFTTSKPVNPYYNMLTDEFISRGIDFRFSTKFQFIEDIVKGKNRCILHLHQIEHHYHLDGDEEATRLNARKFLDNVEHIKTLGAKLVWTMHNPVPHDRKFQKIDEKVNEEMFSLSDHIIVLGRYPKVTLIRDQNVKAPISIIMHPSYREVYPSNMDKIQARRELGLPIDALIFGNIASIKPYKGHEFIIDAFKEVLKGKNSSQKLILLFAGITKGEDYANSLRERCDLLRESDPLKDNCDSLNESSDALKESDSLTDNRDSNLIIMDKHLTETELVRIVSALDYSVFAFKDIWASSSVILSLSLQVPVIVPDKGCMSEYVHQRDNGLLYKHGNLDSLIRVLDFATQQKYYKHQQYMCRAYLKELTISNTVDKFEKVYQQVLMESPKLK